MATAVGLFAYQQFNKPKTITTAAGSPDDGPVKMMAAIAGRLPKSSSIRLNIVALGSTLEAAKAFSTNEVDLHGPVGPSRRDSQYAVLLFVGIFFCSVASSVK